MLIEGVLLCVLCTIVYLVYLTQTMTKQGGFFFRIGYCLYSRTDFGHFYHRRDVDKAARKYPSGHSVVESTVYGDLSITPVAMVMDNYSYIVHDTSTDTCVLIDPSVPEVVQSSLQSSNLRPQAILTTHKHWDHSGGNKALKQQYAGLQVYYGSEERVPGGTHQVRDGEVFQLGNFKFTALFTPGHTVGHFVYLLDGRPFNAPDSLFTGDLLFVGGVGGLSRIQAPSCYSFIALFTEPHDGAQILLRPPEDDQRKDKSNRREEEYGGRMFECHPGVMLRSLDRILTLQDTTLVWPGHEYANDNLEFAISLDANNTRLQEKYSWVLERRKNRQTAIPSTLGDEKLYNPFIRTHHIDILNALDLNQDSFETDEEKRVTRTKALSEIRRRKDQFKYNL